MSNEETPVTDGQAAEQVYESPTSESNDSTAEGTVQEEAVSLAEFQKLQTQSQEYLEGWQRARAEFANYKKRVDRDLKDSHQNATGDVIKSLLPVIDDFDRAMANVPQELQENAWVSGIEMIQRKLNKILEDFGVDVLDPVGEEFDPTMHEAVGQDTSSDLESGYVTATMQKGYKMGDRVLRPALVRVAQ